MSKDKKEVAEEREQAPEPKKGANMKMILFAVIGLVVVSAGGVGGFYFLKTSETPISSAPPPVMLTIWPMDALVVNLADTGGERYLKLVIQLELSHPAVVQELEQIKPKIRDKILDLLTPKTYKELMDLAGKQRLREDIAGRINNILSKGKVTKVYFTDFVVQ